MGTYSDPHLKQIENFPAPDHIAWLFVPSHTLHIYRLYYGREMVTNDLQLVRKSFQWNAL